MRTYELKIEDESVLVEIRQYDRAGEVIAVSTLLPPDIEKPPEAAWVCRHPNYKPEENIRCPDCGVRVNDAPAVGS